MSIRPHLPSEYVDYLTVQGLRTSRGPVQLNTYVSTSRTRFPLAYQANHFFQTLASGFTDSELDLTPSGGRTHAWSSTRAARLFPVNMANARIEALRALEVVRAQIIAGAGRTSEWRHVFTGQGRPDDIIAVMNLMVAHPALLAGAPGSGDDSLGHFLDRGELTAAGLNQMVQEHVFGLDCLGFVGTYLEWIGAVPRVPESEVANYARHQRMTEFTNLSEITPRTVLLWDATVDDRGHDRVQHIAIVDRVQSAGEREAVVDICQSSRGGPQTNRGVRLVPAAGGGFAMRGHGDPPAPVSRNINRLAKHPRWS
ncbi:hypothetical protein IP84_05265 [beta proteobacterium AAP99]|nr:hypothetical protein IP84_05265 [beta proteobacterium AAP99]